MKIGPILFALSYKFDIYGIFYLACLYKLRRINSGAAREWSPLLKTTHVNTHNKRKEASICKAQVLMIFLKTAIIFWDVFRRTLVVYTLLDSNRKFPYADQQ